MRLSSVHVVALLLVGVSSVVVAPTPTAVASGQAPAPLVLVQRIPLPAVAGRIDHLAVDVDRHRLYVAALGNNTVEVVDLQADKRAASIAGFHEPQGIAVVPSLKRVVVANGQGGEVQVRDAGDPTLRITNRVALSDDADNVRHDAKAGRVYVGYGGGALAAIDPADGRRLHEIALAGHPESFQLEKAGPRIFVNVPSAGHVAVLDRDAAKVLATWPVTEAHSNYPMALDEDGRRLFIGCRRPAKVLIYDTASGKVTGSMEIVGDTDDLFYDAVRKRLYVSGGDGFLDVFQQQDAAHFIRIAHEPTAAGARTSLFVPELGRLYLAVPHRGAQRAEVRVYEAMPQTPPPVAASAAADAARAADMTSPTVLFICPHGAAKSVLASAYFKQLAAERGIRVQTDAVGIEPGPEVGRAVAARLNAQHLAVPIAKPRKVTSDDIARADIVISVGCDVSSLPATSKLRRWDDVPDIGADFDGADNALRAKAQALVDEIVRAR